MTDFSLFGFGYGGLPSEVDLWFTDSGEIGRLAQAIIEECETKARDALNKTKRPRVSNEVASIAFLMVAWHNKHAKPIPPFVMTALAHAMNLVSYSGGGVRGEVGRSAVSDELKRRIGMPVTVAMFNWHSFLLASALDGEADASGSVRLKREALAGPLGVSDRTIDAWRKEPLYIKRRVVAKALGRPGPAVPKTRDDQIAWVREKLKPTRLTAATGPTAAAD